MTDRHTHTVAEVRRFNDLVSARQTDMRDRGVDRWDGPEAVLVVNPGSLPAGLQGDDLDSVNAAIKRITLTGRSAGVRLAAGALSC